MDTPRQSRLRVVCRLCKRLFPFGSLCTIHDIHDQYQYLEEISTDDRGFGIPDPSMGGEHHAIDATELVQQQAMPIRPGQTSSADAVLHAALENSVAILPAEPMTQPSIVSRATARERMSPDSSTAESSRVAEARAARRSSTYSTAVTAWSPSNPVLFPTTSESEKGKLEPLVYDRPCDRGHPERWPQNFMECIPAWIALPRQKWFPGTQCDICTKEHPSAAHDVYWEAFMEKKDRDVKAADTATMCATCVENGQEHRSKTHFKRSHGLMEPFDLPTNPPIAALNDPRLMKFERKWPEALGRIPYHPYAYFPVKLQDQKPPSYPNLHNPVFKIKININDRLMINDGNAAEQLAALQAGKNYTSAGPTNNGRLVRTPAPVHVAGVRRATGPPGIEGQVENPPGTLPKSFWREDGSSFPSKAFCDVIYPMISQDEVAYCERMRKLGVGYSSLLTAFQSLLPEEKELLSMRRKEAHTSAWVILRRYEREWPEWRSGFDKAILDMYKSFFDRMPRFEPDSVYQIVASKEDDEIDEVLKAADAEAAEPRPEISFQNIRADHRNTRGATRGRGQRGGREFNPIRGRGGHL